MLRYRYFGVGEVPKVGNHAATTPELFWTPGGGASRSGWPGQLARLLGTELTPWERAGQEM